MINYVIEESSREEYNLSKVPFTQEPSFIPINRVIKGVNGEVLAGISHMKYNK